MIKRVVCEHKSLAELYPDLLIKQREIVLEEQQGTAECALCKQSKSSHLADGRCSSSCLSGNFLNQRFEERESIEKAVVLVEKLRRL